MNPKRVKVSESFSLSVQKIKKRREPNPDVRPLVAKLYGAICRLLGGTRPTNFGSGAAGHQFRVALKTHKRETLERAIRLWEEEKPKNKTVPSFIWRMNDLVAKAQGASPVEPEPFKRPGQERIGGLRANHDDRRTDPSVWDIKT